MEEPKKPAAPSQPPFKKETMDHMQSPEVRSGARVFGWVVVVVLVLGAFVAGYFVNASMRQQQPQTVATSTPENVPPTSGENQDEIYAQFVPGDVVWETAPKSVPVTFFTANVTSTTKYKQWFVGTVREEGAWNGAEIHIVRADGLVEYGQPIFLHVLKRGTAHVVLGSYSNDQVIVGLGEVYELRDRMDEWKVAPGTVWNNSIKIDELELPTEIVSVKERVSFAMDGEFGGSVFGDGSPFSTYPEEMNWFVASDYEPAVSVPVWRNSTTTMIMLYREKKVSTGLFYAPLADGSYVKYRMDLPFAVARPEADNATAITWSNGTNNTIAYAPYTAGGCGFTLLMISDTTLANNAEFKIAGRVIPGFEGAGDTRVYEYRDPNHAKLKGMYDAHRTSYEYRHPGTTLSYDAFVALHPIIFWQDQFGRAYEMHSTEFLPVAECGKPVIYLYPEKAQQVNVQVQPMNGFSITEPLYPTGGWNVIAEPTGRLTDVRDNKTWGYLFWEGKGSVVGTPESRGFVVAKDEVPAFLERTLTQLGLNTQERADFAEFWVPRMQRTPYYFVTFYDNTLMNRIAPLRVTPRPDTTIRILMDYQPLTERKEVEPLPIRTPERKGFTVVEWGGVLR
ncbi:MAG: hypothetical protein AAB384_02545 [Patescibacteria group bacterium]